MGEYTQKSNKRKTCTFQFFVKDMALKKGKVILPRNVLLEELMEATAATLRLSNQKNGLRGILVHRSAK